MKNATQSLYDQLLQTGEQICDGSSTEVFVAAMNRHPDVVEDGGDGHLGKDNSNRWWIVQIDGVHALVDMWTVDGDSCDVCILCQYPDIARKVLDSIEGVW